MDFTMKINKGLNMHKKSSSTSLSGIDKPAARELKSNLFRRTGMLKLFFERSFNLEANVKCL